MSDVSTKPIDPLRLPETIWLGNDTESLYLITSGAAVDVTDDYGYTPLTLAANDGSMEEVLRQLLRRGADPNKKADDGATALTLAVRRDDVEMVKELVEHGALLNEKGLGGFTPLIWCLHSDAPQCMAYLIEKGADLDAPGADGHTAEDWWPAFSYNGAADVLSHALAERRRAQEEEKRQRAEAAAKVAATAQHDAAVVNQDALRDHARRVPVLKRPKP